MNTSRSEENILGIILQHPCLIPVVEANKQGLFSSEYSRVAWDVIDELYSRGDPVNVSIMADHIIDRVKPTWIHDLFNGVFGISEKRAEPVLLETIGFVKRQRASNRISSELREAKDLQENNFETFRLILDDAQVSMVEKEKSDVGESDKAYMEWQEMERTGITTGLPSIDRLTDQFNYGEIIAIMGRTTTGKTFLALNILDNLVRDGVKNIGFFSMEMSRATLHERILQLHFGLSRQDVSMGTRSGTLDRTDVIKKYSGVRFYDQVYSADSVRAIIERDKLKVIFIDYLQLMKSDDGQSIYEKTTYRMHSLKAIAKNTKCAIFLLVQLSRRGEGGWEPVTIDMARDSGAVEENSDFILGLWNPSLKEGSVSDLHGKVRVKLLKNKRGPGVGIECVFNPVTGKLYEEEEGL